MEKNKTEKEGKNNQPHPHEYDSDGDVLFATFTGKGSVSDWILILGAPIIYVLKRADFQHMI